MAKPNRMEFGEQGEARKRISITGDIRMVCKSAHSTRTQFYSELFPLAHRDILPNGNSDRQCQSLARTADHSRATGEEGGDSHWPAGGSI